MPVEVDQTQTVLLGFFLVCGFACFAVGAAKQDELRAFIGGAPPAGSQALRSVDSSADLVLEGDSERAES